MSKLTNLFRNKQLLSSSLIVISASLFGNFFGYLFQLLTGRYFSVEDYSVLVALFSLSGIIPLVIQPYMGGLPKLVAEIKDDDYPNRISLIFFSVLKVQLGLSLLILVLMILFAKQIAEYLNIHDSTLIVMFSLAVVAGVFFSFINPFLQGLMRFKAFSFMQIFTSILKFLVAIVVIALGLNVNNIFEGLLLTTILSTIIGFFILKKNIVNRIKAFDKEDFIKLIKYSLGAALAIIGITFINNNDVILVKHFFNPVEAGIYSSLSIIGKIVYYAAAPIAIVLLPVISNKYSKGQDFTKPFYSSLALALLISGSIALVYWVFPAQIINLLFGAKYLPAEELLPLFGLYMVIFTILTVFGYFFIGISKFKYASLIFVAALGQIIGVYLYHDTLREVIYVSMISCSFILVVMIFLAAKIIYPFRSKEIVHSG